MQDVYRGRVEVLYNGVWGRICQDEDWTIRESDVVCRQLGYDGALLNAYIGGRFNVDVGVVGFTSVRCIGNESLISNCAFRGRRWGVVQSCGYGYDSGVMCNPPGKKVTPNYKFTSKLFCYLLNLFIYSLIYLIYIYPTRATPQTRKSFVYVLIDFFFLWKGSEENITKKPLFYVSSSLL